MRDPEDHYQTPAWAVRAVLPYLPPLAGKRILEPSAGRGAIVRELLRGGASLVVAVELNAGRARDLCRPALAEEQRDGSLCPVAGDFVLCTVATLGGMFDLVVMNPPYEAAEEHIRHAVSLLAPGGTVAALCRLAFLSEGQERASLRHDCPHDRVELVRRPSFTAESLAYLTDADLFTMATDEEYDLARAKAKRPKARKMALDERVVGIVRARLRRTDSCAYAWGLFGEGRGGRFYTHEEAS